MNSPQIGAWTDEAAVQEARAGNADGFRVLVERHGRTIFRLAYRMTGNEQDAEDLVQETFLRAAKQLDRFDGRSSFGTWLYRIASNCSVDLLRSRKVREQRTVSIHEDTQSDPMERFAANSPSPEQLSFSSEINKLLGPAMHQLTHQERTAFVLRHFEGLGIEEISRVLNVRPNAAKHSVFRAVQKLRRSLEPAIRTRIWRIAE
jgi:RNA polymerase sigma-70 factor (ECF subfamily)